MRENQIAEEIVNLLFENGSGEKADRLVLTTKDGKDLGGWSRRGAFLQILGVLQSVRDLELPVQW